MMSAHNEDVGPRFSRRKFSIGGIQSKTISSTGKWPEAETDTTNGPVAFKDAIDSS